MHKQPHSNLYVTESSEFYTDISKELIKYFSENIPNLFKKKKDMDIAYSVLELLQKQEEIENFNKKALYILIREMTNVKTNEITKVVNVLKKHYRRIVWDYNNGGKSKSNPPIKRFF